MRPWVNSYSGIAPSMRGLRIAHRGAACSSKCTTMPRTDCSMARFVPRDNGAVNRQIAIDSRRRHGRPVAFYVDKAGHFGQWTRPVSDAVLEELDLKRRESIIRRALRELNIELILAHSPQAKGRVERNFGTSHDRLIKEMLVQGISTLQEGNRYRRGCLYPLLERTLCRRTGRVTQCPSEALNPRTFLNQSNTLLVLATSGCLLVARPRAEIPSAPDSAQLAATPRSAASTTRRGGGPGRPGAIEDTTVEEHNRAR